MGSETLVRKMHSTSRQHWQDARDPVGGGQSLRYTGPDE
jgi:hypothetical protein